MSGRRREERRLARALSAGAMGPAEAAGRAMSLGLGMQAALDAWTSAALSGPALDEASRLTKGAVAAAVMSSLGAGYLMPYSHDGALVGPFDGASRATPGCGWGGRVVVARTARIRDVVDPGEPPRMAALVVPTATKPGPPVVPLLPLTDAPRRERLYDTEAFDDGTPLNLTFFIPPVLPSQDQAPAWPTSMQRRPERIAICVVVLPAAVVGTSPDRRAETFHMPCIEAIRARFAPSGEERLPEWAWGAGADVGDFSAEDDVVRVPTEVANVWACRSWTSGR